uniref:Uncharacterized protein n=1 Tax=viral metagenome TaxID=1070528 RepID=A0A6H1ZKJ0_9ZZZZ
MSTSNSTDWTIARDAIITSALRKLRRIDPNLTVPAIDITTGTEALNMMIKAWQTDGVFLWLNEEICLFQQYNTQFYTLGPSGTGNCGLLSDSFKTQLAAAAAVGAGTITVDSDDNIANADYVGIQLDGGTIQWTTVNGIPAADVVTLTAVLTGAAAVDNYVFTYTTKAPRPLKILEARVRDTDDVDTPLEIITSRTQFLSQTDKDSTGRVLEIHYNPDITNGQLYTWPVCGTTDITDRIIMSVQRVIEDFDSSTDNFDGPPEALAALTWGLAVEVAPEYGVDILSGKGTAIPLMAEKYYNLLKKHYRSYDPVYMRP